MSRVILTYEPDNSLKQGYLFIFREIFNEVKKNRWLISQLFKREFFATYKQSFMGVLWAFFIPIISICMFIVLNQSGVLSIGDIHVPYPLYAVLGMAFWQLFSRGLVASSNALVNAGSMIAKINFSKKSLVIASTGQSIIPFLVQLVLVALLFVYYRTVPSIAIFLIPVVIIPMILLTLGFGFILSLLNGIVRDVGNMLSILMTFLMFLTPVLYAKPKTGILATVTNYNPLYYLISVPRELILMGTISEGEGFFIATILSITVFLVCIFVFHLTEARIAERI